MGKTAKKKKNRKRRRQRLALRAAFLFMLVLGCVSFLIVYISKSKVRDASSALAVPTIAMGNREMLMENTVYEAVSAINKEAEAEESMEEQVKVEPVVMAFLGDICFYDEYANMHSLKNRGGSIESSISADLLERMRQADILMLNNEFAYSGRGVPLADKAFTFRSRPENVALLSEMGVDIVSLANNHVYDYGEDALFDTLDTLQAAGMPYVGAGRNLDEASAPYYYEVKGRIIAFISATQVERNDAPDTKGATSATAGTFRCFNDEEFDRLVQVIKEADAKADFTVVYIHWGTENTDELHWLQTKQAPLIVEAGADLIVGDHPHCLQGIEYIEGVPVFYSLGNFWFNSKTLDTGLLEVTLDEKGETICRFLPAKQHDCRTDLMSGEEKQRILLYLQCISPDVTIDEEGYIYDRPYEGPPIPYDEVQRVPPKREDTVPEVSPKEQNPAGQNPEGQIPQV